MTAIFFLIGCSVFMALIFLFAFFWANKTGQNEDTYTPAIRILFDDELVTDGSENTSEHPSESAKKDPEGKS